MNRNLISIDTSTSGQNQLNAQRVLFVLNDNERNLFMPRYAQQMPTEACSWLDARGMDESEFENALQDFQPTVIVTAWHCPPLPKAWANADSCPLKYVCSVTGAVKQRVPRELIERGILVSN